MEYKLMALDMDGTLLKSDKSVDPHTLESIRKAQDAGKIIVICSGRAMAEMKAYRDAFTDAGIRYYVCESGAYLYDALKNQAVAVHPIAHECLPLIFSVMDQEDMMVQMMVHSHSNVTGSQIENMAHWQMEVYIPLYETCTDKWNDVIAYGRRVYEKNEPIEKINLYHTDPAARNRTRNRILSGLSDPSLLKLVDAETTSLEISGSEADKGSGLMELAEYLGIDRRQVIAVGDADNDLTMLENAGLPVAMGNANEHVLSYVKENGAVTKDNDHDGCGAAIRQFLLKENI